MLTTELYDIFKKSSFSKYFDGVYPSDLIPKTLKVNHFIVCNIDDSSQVGSHWYVVYRHNLCTIEIFDSLGVTEQKKIFLTQKFNFAPVTKLKCNITALQSKESLNCGLFCLYFIHNRLYNKDLGYSELLQEIFLSPSNNEVLVTNFYKDNYADN